MVGNIAVGSLLAADTVDAAAAVGLAVAAAVPEIAGGWDRERWQINPTPSVILSPMWGYFMYYREAIVPQSDDG